MPTTQVRDRRQQYPRSRGQHITMRLSDAGAEPQPKLLNPDHRLPPWLNEYATRDRSNRLFDGSRQNEVARPSCPIEARHGMPVNANGKRVSIRSGNISPLDNSMLRQRSRSGSHD